MISPLYCYYIIKYNSPVCAKYNSSKIIVLSKINPVPDISS